MRETLAPSDLAAQAAGPVRVGGRLRAAGDDFRICDAFASIPVQLTKAPLDGLEGALVVVDGHWHGGSIAGAVLVLQTAAGGDGGVDSDVLRLTTRGVGHRLRARARAVAAVRRYFEAHGFLEVETPTIVPCPGLDLHLDAFEVVAERGPRFLITSPEYQMKRLLVGGVPRCFQLAKSFRAGERGAVHNPEFTMLEWYRAFAGVEEVIADTEAIVRLVIDEFAGADTSSRWHPAGEAFAESVPFDLSVPFRRVSLAEAFLRFAGVPEEEMLRLANEDEERYFRILVEEIEPRLAESPAPVVLWRYPAKMASLARLCPDDRRYAERFEIYLRGVELCNGFGELVDPVEQRARFEIDQRERAQLGKPVYPLDERFLGALVEGMPPAAGNALGFDRLLMLALGAESIADVMTFSVNEL